MVRVVVFDCGLVFIVVLGCLDLVFLGWCDADCAIFGAGLGWLAGSLCWVLWDCLKMLILAFLGWLFVSLLILASWVVSWVFRFVVGLV